MSDGDRFKKLRKALLRVFSGDDLCVQRLIAALDSKHTRYRPFHLSACKGVHSYILSYAQHSAKPLSGCEEWNGSLNATCFRNESGGGGDVDYASVLFVRALLVGNIDADRFGAMKISSPDCPEGVQIVIAPPPDVRLRNTPIWIRDWRYVPSRLLRGSVQCIGVFEVLLKDVVSLRESTRLKAPLLELTRDIVLNPYKTISVRGVINGKSCIIASRHPSACFFVELASNDESKTALSIVFRGKEAVKWWPFLKLGSEFGFTGLTMSVLPSYMSRTVLKASGEKVKVHVIEPEEITRRHKRPRVEVENESSACVRPSNGWAQQKDENSKSLVTYDGEITRVLADGRFELDGKVTLHLGGFNGSCAGPAVATLCFRKGARVQACWVLAVPRAANRISLLPTARTIVNILYFGCLSSRRSMKGSIEWSQTPWRWLWKRWDYLDLLWAEELFDSLVLKFKPWLADLGGDETQQDETLSLQVVESLLGSQGSTGLVQFIMHLQSGRDDVMKTDGMSGRNVYKEFFDVQKYSFSMRTFRYTQMPSLQDIKSITNVLWKNAMSTYVTKHENLKRPVREDFFQLVVGPEKLSTAMSQGSGSPQPSQCERMQSIALVGLLQGSCVTGGQLELSDATWSINARCLGDVQPSLLGAIVLISEFTLLLESRKDLAGRTLTVLFKPESAQVVVDGPYAKVSGQFRKALPRASTQRTHDELLRNISQAALRDRTRTQRQSQQIEDDCSSDNLVIDVPLVCIYVQRTYGQKGKFTVVGRLIAVTESRNNDEWQALDHNKKGFWRCSITLSGEAALQVSPAVQEKRLFALSCTDLNGKIELAEHLHRMAREQAAKGKLLDLATHLETKSPWVENLGNGYYMKFMARKNDENANHRRKRLLELDHSVSSEAERYAYVHEAIESFRKEFSETVSKSLWEAYQWKNNSKKKDMRMTIRGIVDIISDEKEVLGQHGRADTCTITLRDPQLQCFSLTICFYDVRAIPTGLAPGMLVAFHNVVRIPTYSTDRFIFVGNCGCMCRVEAWEPPIREKKICQDCLASRQGLKDVIPLIRHVYLWELSERKEAEAGVSQEAGIIRHHIVRVHDVHFSLLACDLECSKCGVLDECGEAWAVRMKMIATTEDGSSQAKLLCCGFELCSRILNLTEKEKKELKQVALETKTLHIDENDMAQMKPDNIGLGHSKVTNRVVKILSKSRRTKNAIVLNRTCMSSTTHTVRNVNEVQMKGFGLGFGRKLWTACPANDEVIVECVAVVDECCCDDVSCCKCAGSGLRPLDTARLLLRGQLP